MAGRGAGDRGCHGHQDHDVEKYFKEPLDLVEGMVEGLKELLIAGQAPGIIHHHRLTHGQRQKQHGHDGGHHTGPAQADVIGIGLGCRWQSRRRRGRRTGPRLRRRLRRMGSWEQSAFSWFLPPANRNVGWFGRKTKNPFVSPALWQKRRKDEKPSAVPLFFVPFMGTPSTGYHHIPAL